MNRLVKAWSSVISSPPELPGEYLLKLTQEGAPFFGCLDAQGNWSNLGGYPLDHVNLLYYFADLLNSML